MKIDTQRKLVEALDRCGIEYEQIDFDEYGFSRTYKCHVLETGFIIEWFCNFSTIIIGNLEFWIDEIRTYSGYPKHGEWIEFSRQGKLIGVHLRVK